MLIPQTGAEDGTTPATSPATNAPSIESNAAAPNTGVGVSAWTTTREDVSPLRSRLEFAAKAFIVTSFLGALVAGALRLGQRALVAREYRVDFSRWTVLKRPAWSTLEDVQAIRRQSGLEHAYSSLFDTAALATVDGYLSRPATVRRVAGVRRVFPNRIEAVLELRRPAVAVRVQGKKELFVETDEEGVALSVPLDMRPVREGFPLRVVVGAVGTVPAPGAKFGPDVIAAASIAEFLDSYSDDAGRALLATVDRIDVANYGGRTKLGASEIVLGALPRPPEAAVSASAVAHPVPAVSPKVSIEWGRAGDRPDGGHEMPFDAKASRLLQALRLFPGLAGLKIVKVAFNDLSIVADGPNAPPQLVHALEIDGGVQSK